MFIPVPMILRGRILREFKNAGAVGKNNAKTLAELDMEKWPFTGFGAKRIFEALLKRGVILNDGDKYYLAK